MDVVRGIFGSKKFVAGIVGSLAVFAGQFFPAWAATGSALQGVAAVNWVEVTAPLMVAIGAQGLADFGKESR